MDTCPTRPSCADCSVSERLVCRCLQVTEAVLIQVLTTREIRTLKDLRQHTGAGDGCTACHVRLKRYLEEHAYSSVSPICSVK